MKRKIWEVVETVLVALVLLVFFVSLYIGCFVVSCFVGGGI